MRNQKLGRERGSTTPVESGQSEINQYKLVVKNPRASDNASEQNTSGAVTHAHGGALKKRRCDLVEEIRPSPAIRPKRARLTSAKGWRFWLPASSDVEGDDSLLTTTRLTTPTELAPSRTIIHQHYQPNDESPREGMAAQRIRETCPMQTLVLPYTRRTARTADGDYLFTTPQKVTTQS
ncbi:unnamed protein product [Linum trigynum]|uniref:Uncharacterized protein n=1 Tax=Linum trigynum TaxID=586398 RepID=A0AAV2G0W5_9ROSI